MRVKRSARGTVRILAVVAGIALVGAGCGDDDGDDNGASVTTGRATTTQRAATSTTAGDRPAGDTAEFCDALIEVDAAFAAGGPEGPDPAQVQPAMQNAQQTAPDEISEEVDRIIQLVGQAFASPDAEPSDEVFAEIDQLDTEIDDYALENCEFEELEITGIDYAYTGVPSTLDAGQYALTFTNDSESGEAHEAIVLRRNAGVTESFEDILAADDPEEALTKVTIAGAAFADEQGGTDTTFVDLEEGEYAVVCFIPVGSTGGEEGEGPPHLTRGMIAQFEVS